MHIYEFVENKITEAAEVPLPTRSISNSNHSLFLVSLPLSMSYYFLEKGLSVSLGALPGLLVYSTGGIGPSTAFNKAHIGIQVQLRYQVYPKIWVMGGFQEYSSKLYDPMLKQSFSNIRLIKLGLKYDI